MSTSWFAAHQHREAKPPGYSGINGKVSIIGSTPNQYSNRVRQWWSLITRNSSYGNEADDKFAEDLQIRKHKNVLLHISTELDDFDEETAVKLVTLVMRILEVEYNKQNTSIINFIDAWNALEPIQNSKWGFFRQPKQDTILMELFSTKEKDNEKWPSPTLVNHIIEIMMPSSEAAANAESKAAIAKRTAAWESFIEGKTNRNEQFNKHGGRRTRRHHRKLRRNRRKSIRNKRN
jgi:hypothetical protein